MGVLPFFGVSERLKNRRKIAVVFLSKSGYGFWEFGVVFAYS